jgi:hypothetical protein
MELIDPNLQDSSSSTYPQGLQQINVPSQTSSGSLPPQQQRYPPLNEAHYSPHSAGHIVDDREDGGGGSGDHDETKRPRACEQCRSLKVGHFHIMSRLCWDIDATQHINSPKPNSVIGKM